MMKPLIILCVVAKLLAAQSTRPRDHRDSTPSSRSYGNIGNYYMPEQDRQPYPSYQDYPQSYYYTGPSGAAEGVPGCPTGGVQGHSLMEDVLHVGATKLGLLGLIKATVAALATGLLAKFPLLLLKLLFKVGLLSLVIPIFLPLILPLISGISFTANNNTTAATRGLPGLREWERWDPNHCLQRFACYMGAHTSGREQTDAVTRLLEKLQMSQVPENRRLLEMYREAYLRGSEEKSCHQHYQTCEMVDGFIGRLT